MFHRPEATAVAADRPEMHPAWREAEVTTESGAGRLAINIILGWPHMPPWAAVIAFETALEDAFGGYTRFDGNGAWEGASEEALVFYIVTDLTLPDINDRLNAILGACGAGLDTERVHVDIRSVWTYHKNLEPRREAPHTTNPRLEGFLDKLIETHAGQWPRGDRTRDDMWRDAHGIEERRFEYAIGGTTNAVGGTAQDIAKAIENYVHRPVTIAVYPQEDNT